jgi:TonB family protein
MGIRRNIIISLILHAVMISATFSINYRERVSPLPKDCMLVSLVEEFYGNRFFEITQNNNKRHPEHSEGSKKQYSLLSVRSVPSQEILRLHLRMTADKGITGGEGTEMAEKSKDEIALTMPRDRDANENYGGFFNEAETKTERGGNDGYGIVSTEISEGIMPGQGTELFAVKGQLRDGGNSSVFEAIRSAIERAKNYPFLARKKKIEGTVITEFTISSRGNPEDIKIKESSGSEILDSAAIKIITKAAPFPKVNSKIVIPITFKLIGSLSDR